MQKESNKGMEKRFSHLKYEFYSQSNCLINDMKKKFMSQTWIQERISKQKIEGFYGTTWWNCQRKNITDVKCVWSCPDLSKHDEIHVKKY